ncbi:MAG: DOMON domain-containing protein [candidate division WOR-3 bacterium]
MSVTRLLTVTFLLFGYGLAQEMPVVPYDSLMEDRVSIDGYVDREDNEYPGYLKSPSTGLTVSWGFDDSLIYLALETRGRGWFGIGFGAPGMDGSNMLVGFYTDDSAEVYNLVGKAHGHPERVSVDSLDLDWEVDFDDETGVMTLEVAYPLTWRGEGAPAAFSENRMFAGTAIPGLVPGDTFDLILAQNTKSVSLGAKHSHRTTLKARLAERPKPSAQSKGEE